MESRFLLVIQLASIDLLDVVQKLRKLPSCEKLGLVVITTRPDEYGLEWGKIDAPVRIVACDFTSDDAIRACLAPFRASLAGVICRGDRQVQYLRRLIPFLPAGVPVASAESLIAATNKRVMRAAFTEHYPEITPRFLAVYDDSPATIAAIEVALAYPVIIKPAHLASSLLIQSCHNQAELIRALRRTFSEIHAMYNRAERHDTPEVIVEEYLQGQFYTVDAYVAESETIAFCPPVAYIPAKQLGVDDFFLYKRFVPTGLKLQEIAALNRTAAKAIQAVSLQHSTVHVELVRTAKGWKIIELGPRLGRFRNLMYNLAYGLDHAYNDARLHVGEKPIIPKKLRQFCATYSIFPEQEGRLCEITHLEELARHPSISYLRVFLQVGEQCRFAKYGGQAAAEIAVATPDKPEFERVTRFIEENVRAVID